MSKDLVDSTQDNIAEVDAADEYMDRFELVIEKNEELSTTVDTFKDLPNDQKRLYAAMDYIRALQDQNNRIVDLLVEMNNYFGNKSA